LGESAEFESFRFPVPVTFATVAGAIPEGLVERMGLMSAGGGTTAGTMEGVLTGELVDAGLGAGLVIALCEGPDIALVACCIWVYVPDRATPLANSAK